MLATAAAIFSVLLIVTGVAKIIRPHDVAKALAAFGLPPAASVGVAIGLLEVAVGAGAIVVPGLLAAQGVLYGAFAGWVVLALRSNVPIASCGCLGRDDTPPTVAHVLLDVIASALSFGALVGQPLALAPGLGVVAQCLVVATGVFLSYVVLTDAALLVGARE